MNINHLLIILYSIFLAPTHYTYIRETYLPSMPSFVSPTLLLGIIILFITAIRVIYNKERLPLIPKRLLVPYLSIIILMVVSLNFTPNLEYGLSKTLEFIPVTGLACVLPFFLFRNSGDIKCFIYTLLSIAILLIIIVSVSNLCFRSLSSSGFATKIGGNYLFIQYMLGLAGLIVLYYFLIRKWTIKKTTWWLILFIAIIATMVYVGGRWTPIAFVITTIFMTITSVHLTNQFRIILSDKKMLLFPILVIIMGIVTIIFFIVTQGSNIFVERIIDTLKKGDVTKIENAKIALELFLQHPVSGVGIGGFIVYSLEREGIEKLKYPHNIILELLAELGIFGFIFFFFLMFFAFIHLWHLQSNYKDSYFPNVFLSFLVFTFLCSLTAYDIVNAPLFAFIGMPYAMERYLKKYSVEK